MCIVRVIVGHLDLLRMRHGHCVHGALLIYVVRGIHELALQSSSGDEAAAMSIAAASKIYAVKAPEMTSVERYSYPGPPRLRSRQNH